MNIHPTEPLLVIGDIHGKYDILCKVLDHANNLNIKTIFSGDVIDRGPDSLKCLQAIGKFRKDHPNTELCLGNHEQMMFLALSDTGYKEYANSIWLYNGGSWSINNHDNINQTLTAYNLGIDNWSNYYQSGDVIIVHGGIPYGINKKAVYRFLKNSKTNIPLNDRESENHWAWIRSRFLMGDTPMKGHYIIHGHSAFEFTGIPKDGRCNIDASHKPGIGVALVEGGSIQLSIYS